MTRRIGLKQIKQTLSFIITLGLFMVLYFVIFVKLGQRTIDDAFWIEFLLISFIVSSMKSTWYNWSEDKVLADVDIIESKKIYDDRILTLNIDPIDMDVFCDKLNEENKKKYISNKIGSKTKENYKKYDKLLTKLTKKADKIRPIKTQEIMTRCESLNIVDSKNYMKLRKYIYYTLTTTLSIGASITLAAIAFEEILQSQEALYRYLTYVIFAIYTILTSILAASRITRDETLGHLKRLEHIVDRYDMYKKKGGVM